jgi:hypothetical protein
MAGLSKRLWLHASLADSHLSQNLITATDAAKYPFAAVPVNRNAPAYPSAWLAKASAG